MNSMVTGESMPVTKENGAQVIGGTLNQSGSFVMRADKVGRDTLAGADRADGGEGAAQRARRSSGSPIRSSGWFVPAVIAVALIAFAAWATFGPEPRFAYRPGRRGQRADHRLPLRARAWRRRCRSWSASAAARRPAC